jgi:RNA polymerase sigma factor (sigma-70 family)
MRRADSTCWTLIQAAAAGDALGREHVAHRYEPPVRAYFQARWRSGTVRREVDDAVQEVFLECFKEGGALERVSERRGGGFRAFLQVVAKNVALRFEERDAKTRKRTSPDPDRALDLVDDDAEPDRAFEQSWAREMVRAAALRMEELARNEGEAAEKRVRLLTLRFYDEMPIRDIAELWQVDAAQLHHDYARARQEFMRALREVVAFHQPSEPDRVDEECARLLQVLAGS